MVGLAAWRRRWEAARVEAAAEAAQAEARTARRPLSGAPQLGGGIACHASGRPAGSSSTSHIVFPPPRLGSQARALSSAMSFAQMARETRASGGGGAGAGAGAGGYAGGGGGGGGAVASASRARKTEAEQLAEISKRLATTDRRTAARGRGRSLMALGHAPRLRLALGFASICPPIHAPPSAPPARVALGAAVLRPPPRLPLLRAPPARPRPRLGVDWPAAPSCSAHLHARLRRRRAPV